MFASRRIALLLSAVALAWSPAARALFDPEISHTKVVEPKIANPVDPALGAIGLPSSFSVVGARLIVGGSKGIAALDGSGKVLWVLELPPAKARQVAADETHVAFTSFDQGGVVKTGVMSSSLLAGDLMAKPEFLNATVGLADASGKLLWSVPSVEAAKLSPPALSSKAVGVVGIKTFALYDRATGKPVGEDPVSVFSGFLGLTDGLVAQWPSRAPVVAGEVFHIAHGNYYKRVDAQGNELESARKVGLMTPLEYLPAGPVLLKNRVLFANSPSDRSANPLLVAAKVGGGFDWNDRMDAQARTSMITSSADTPMDIAVNSNAVFVATNFTLLAYSAEGKSLWRDKNKGGLFPSSLRGARYIGNMFERKMGVPSTVLATPMLAATDERVYLATRHTESAAESAASAVTAASAAEPDAPTEGVESGDAGKPGPRRGDAITVLSAKDGSYIESIWFPLQQIYGMTVFGDQLAVATSRGLKLLSLK